MSGMVRGWDRVRPWVVYSALLLVALAAAFAASLGLVAATGGSPVGTISALLDGSVTSASAVVTSINGAIPLLLVAGGTVIAGRAGLVNVGQEGQLLIGALAGTAFGLKVIGTGTIGQIGILVASAVGGGCWVGIAALLKTKARINETVSSLLLNFVAVQLTAFVVSRPWMLQAPPGSQPITPALPVSGELPSLASGVGFSLSSGILLALVLAVLSVVLLRATKFGFELRIFGMNPSCAESFGINRQRLVISSLLISGASAGLAGGVMLSLNPGGVSTGFSGGVGWEGLLVALVAAYNPIAVIAIALGFGALDAGASFVVASGVNATIAAVFEATIALAVLVPQAILRRMRRRVIAESVTVASDEQQPVLPPMTRASAESGLATLAAPADGSVGSRGEV